MSRERARVLPGVDVSDVHPLEAPRPLPRHLMFFICFSYLGGELSSLPPFFIFGIDFVRNLYYEIDSYIGHML